MPRAAIWTGTRVKKSKRYIPRPPHTDAVANTPCKWHDAILVPRYGLQAPCTRGKDVANADTLLVLQTFNIKYDTGIFSRERHRIQLLGCYLGLAFTGARPAEFVDGERKSGKDGCLEEFFPRHALGVSLATKTRRLVSIPGCWKRSSRRSARAADAPRRSVRTPASYVLGPRFG